MLFTPQTKEKTPHCYHLVTLKSACRLQLFAAGAIRPARYLAVDEDTMFLICSYRVLCSDHEPSILTCPQAPAGHGALRAGGCAFSFSRTGGRHRARAAAWSRRAIQ